MSEESLESVEDAEPSKESFGGRRIGYAMVVLAMIVAAFFYGPRARYLLRHENTDDAYVHGNTIVRIAAQVSGRVIDLKVRDNEDVRAGDLLLVVDPSSYEAAVTSLEATEKRVQAELGIAQREFERAEPLVWTKTISQERFDEITATKQGAQAALDVAKADLESARIQLSRTRIMSPTSGRVTLRNVSLGTVVEPGQDLFALVDLEDIWIVANFKETQIDQMRIGQPVDIEVDAFPEQVLSGRVHSFQAGTGSVFSLLPPENATGQFVKVVQRLPVWIEVIDRLDSDHSLYPGLSVVVHVDTSVTPDPPPAPAPASS